MTSASSVTVSVVVKAPPVDSFDFLCNLDPTRFYYRYGPLPAVTVVRAQSGAWNTAGRTRSLELSDGGAVLETITDARSPGYFAYNLSDFERIFGRLVSGARAEWRFEPELEGTRIQWDYAFFALPARRWIVSLIVTLFWAPYMRRILPTIATEIERSSSSR